ncbi:coiled-coil domain-containing protein 110 [Tachysurus fulvidraco]|uniref:coiled-coil domain-containing protein 110 n=1 Tax=Tachysurus fulvidraco TaxID=1234273 RepID=UPI000F4DA1C3|nr:coiled-coil domain-containing protein 110 [Tachysurus fulvidraco]
MLCEGLVKIHHGLLRAKDSGQEFPCSKYDSHFSAKYTKEYWAFLKKHRNMYHGLDKETMELMQDILSRRELRDDDIGMYALGIKALTAMPPNGNDDIELENSQEDLNARRNSHPPNGFSDHSDVKTAVSISSGEKVCDLKGTQPEFICVLKEKLQQKDRENQQIVHLLMLKHHELTEVTKLRDTEAQLMTERLKYEEQKKFEMTKKFNHVFEDMQKQLSMSKSKNEHSIRQLWAILEKYERLKRRVDNIKKHLLEERTERKNCQKELKKTQHMTEELLMNQVLLEEQRDTAKQEYSEFKKNMNTMEEQHNNLVRTIQKLENERSSMRADYGNLKAQLSTTQEENQKLTQALHSKELEKTQAEKNAQESQKLVKQLHEKLKDCKMQRESAEEQQDTIKKELKLIHERYKVKTLQLQEQHKSCMELLEAKRTECEALSEDVSKLKKDKHAIQEELQCLQKEKEKSEIESKKEAERMRDAVSLLKHERKLLLDEMGDLRKDYFSLSDRITQRLEQLEQTDAPMYITDISSSHQFRAAKTNNTVSQFTSNMDMIEHIRRKLEDEENTQQK